MTSIGCRLTFLPPARFKSLSAEKRKYDGMVLPYRRIWVNNCIFNTKQKFESYKEYLISQRNQKSFGISCIILSVRQSLEA